MENFYEKIPVQGQGILSFYFSDVSSVLSPHFWVTVKDKKGNVYLFDMRKRKGQWKIVGHSPDWITAVESQLGEAIKSNLN
ncbi:MAG: hypothetical protein ICV53_11635 [Flavisolibacter sp.]|nr:hypothetical protein [Flavisolibacter sp.]MBD0366739.1 hypothetical protein [Flavisolibacter sp.]